MKHVRKSMTSKDTVLMKEGRWSLIREDSKDARWNIHSSILHYCDSHAINLNQKGYYVHSLKQIGPDDTLLIPSWRCIGCGKPPPKSLLTVFILHNWDDISDEINA